MVIDLIYLSDVWWGLVASEPPCTFYWCVPRWLYDKLLALDGGRGGGGKGVGAWEAASAEVFLICRNLKVGFGAFASRHLRFGLFYYKSRSRFLFAFFFSFFLFSLFSFLFSRLSFAFFPPFPWLPFSLFFRGISATLSFCTRSFRFSLSSSFVSLVSPEGV